METRDGYKIVSKHYTDDRGWVVTVLEGPGFVEYSKHWPVGLRTP